MKLVVGLGNPGERYQRTRHNVGFMVADLLLESSGGPAPCRPGFEGRWARVHVEDVETVLLKPQTFMNRSGRSVRQASEHFGLGPGDLLLVHDDVDLAFGVVRVKKGGGSGGHRGLESCFEELGSRDFGRIRVGVGRPEPGREVTDHVLEEFAETERGGLHAVLRAAAEATRTAVAQGAEAAMNRWNGRPAAYGGEG